MRSPLVKENFYKRLKELSGAKSANNAPASLSQSTLIDFQRANDGVALGIVKENHNYFIKTASKQGDKIGVEDFAYIGGLENKFKYQYNSLAEAEKNRNFYIKTLNESTSKKFKKISINESENIAKAQDHADDVKPEKAQGEADKNMQVSENKNIDAAQTHGDKVDPNKAQGEADKSKGSAPLKDTAVEKEPGEVASSKEIVVDPKQSENPKEVDATKESSAKPISVEKQVEKKVSDVAEPINEKWNKKNVVDPKKKGMFKGKTKEDLHKELTAAKKRGDTTKEKEINFALRAKNKWGKVDEQEVYEGHTIEEYGNEHPVSVDDALKGKVAEDFPPAAGGDENAELDAAASALDGMGAGAPAADAAPAAAPAAEPSAEPEMGAEPSAEPAMGDAEGSIKDIEKLNGKITQKVRATELTPEMTKGFLKSYITAFEDKLGELDHEDRKELANAILNDKEEESGEELGGEEGLGAEPEAGLGDETAVTSDAEEKEIEETINAHLAEMGIGEDENVKNHADIASNTKPFKNYMSERGYNPSKVEEISLMEMVSLMNGYTNECGDAVANADVQGMLEFVTPDVSAKMAESGNGIFENLMKPFGEKIKVNKKAYANEAVIAENFGDEEEGEEEEGSEDDGAAVEVGGDEEGSEPAASIAVGEEPAGEEEAELEIEPKTADAATDVVSFAPAGETMGAGAPGAEKTVTVDLNKNTVSMTLSESTQAKLHKIIAKKIAEQLDGKKPVISEGKKSALSAFIDEEVSKAIAVRRKKIEERLLRK